MRHAVVFLLLLSATAFPQRRVDPKNTYQRVICVTSLTGSGTATDPRRPIYAPWPLPALDNQARITPAGEKQSPIVAFTWTPSDDGKFAIVEFVARNRVAFQSIFKDSSIKVFERGRSSRAEIEAAIQKYRKSFKLDQFGVVMP